MCISPSPSPPPPQDVLFPFGYGLSYTTFAYTGVEAAAATVGPCDDITVTVVVRNTGNMDSDEVIQCYVKQPHASVPVPQVRLAAFSRVHIPAGKTVSVALTLAPDTHTVVLAGAAGGDATGDAIFTAASSRAVESGLIELHCGGGQPDHYAGSVSTTVTVTKAAPISQCKDGGKGGGELWAVGAKADTANADTDADADADVEEPAPRLAAMAMTARRPQPDVRRRAGKGGADDDGDAPPPCKSGLCAGMARYPVRDSVPGDTTFSAVFDVPGLPKTIAVRVFTTIAFFRTSRPSSAPSFVHVRHVLW